MYHAKKNVMSRGEVEENRDRPGWPKRGAHSAQMSEAPGFKKKLGSRTKEGGGPKGLFQERELPDDKVRGVTPKKESRGRRDWYPFDTRFEAPSSSPPSTGAQPVQEREGQCGGVQGAADEERARKKGKKRKETKKRKKVSRKKKKDSKMEVQIPPRRQVDYTTDRKSLGNSNWGTSNKTGGGGEKQFSSDQLHTATNMQVWSEKSGCRP